MFAIAPASADTRHLTPNLLPCTIRHSGPIPVSQRHWDPTPAKTSTSSQTNGLDGLAEGGMVGKEDTDIETDLSVPNSDTSPNAPDKNMATFPDGTMTAYFRGRRLLGRPVALPKGYKGMVLKKTGQNLPVPRREIRRQVPQEDMEDEEEDEGDDETPVDVQLLAHTATFDNVMVWGHERMPEDEDVYVRGVEEWIGFAEAMHSYDQHDTGNS